MASQKSTSSKRGISGERLNLILALCAIFISAASFYATYLQAASAEKQVKAINSCQASTQQEKSFTG